MLPVRFLKLIFFSLVISGSVFEVVGDVFFKRWSLENKNVLFYIGITAYIIGTIFWAFSLKYEVLSKAISIFIISNLIIVVLVGVFFFKENLTLMNKIGIILGIMGIILIEI